MKTFLLGLTLLFCSANSYAALITYNDYTLDQSTNIVTGGGLEWLQWDVTAVMSINSALNDAADGIIGGVSYGTGWRLATNVEMAALFNAFIFGASFTWDADENTTQSISNNDGDVENLSTDPELQFYKLFGLTSPYDPIESCLSANPCQSTFAIFGEDADGDLRYNIAEVSDDYRFASGGTSRNGRVGLERDQINSTSADSQLGVALVRTVKTESVPEPSTISLFALSVLVLSLVRRRIS